MKTQATQTDYKTRAGSTASRAIQALLDGPMNCQDLGRSIDVAPAKVATKLHLAISGHAIVRLQDETGAAYFALPGMDVDDSFKPYGASLPVNANDPFGLIAKQTAGANPAKPKDAAPSKGRRTYNRKVPGAAGPGKPAERPVSEVPPVADGDFAVGLLSNGTMMINQAGQQVLLTKQNSACLVGYLEKVAGLL